MKIKSLIILIRPSYVAINRSWWTVEKLTSLLVDVGFNNIKIVDKNNSTCDLFLGKKFNKNKPDQSFFLEAIKIS